MYCCLIKQIASPQTVRLRIYWSRLFHRRKVVDGEKQPLYFCFNHKSTSMHEPHGLRSLAVTITYFQRKSGTVFKIITLSYYFTKNRPSKIFKIEKNNRQANYKNGLILTKKTAFQVRTMILWSWKHTLELLFTCFRGIKACK